MMEFTEQQVQQIGRVLDEAHGVSVSIYKQAMSYESGAPLKRQLRKLMSLIRKAQDELSTASGHSRPTVEHSSIELNDLPLLTVDESLPQSTLFLKRFEDATATDLKKYGIQTYVTTYPKQLDVLLSCDCDNERAHYHMCKLFDWDRYLNNKRRFCPGRYTAEY